MEQSLLVVVILGLIRLFVGGMLVLAGVLKLKAGPHWFLQQILAYELVKGKVAWLLARGLPWTEICCGVLLLFGLMTPLITVTSFVLLWGFTAAVVSTFLRGKPVDCGCFGHRINTQAHHARWNVAYRNLSLMAALTFMFTVSITPPSLDTVLNNLYYYSPTTAKLLITIWIGSLILTIGLQIWIRRHLVSDVSMNQTIPLAQNIKIDL